MSPPFLADLDALETARQAAGPPLSFLQTSPAPAAVLLDNPSTRILAANGQILALLVPSPWDTAFFGFACAKLIGPWFGGAPFPARLAASQALAAQALAESRRAGFRFLMAKPVFEPALIQGFLAAGFILAEPVTALVKPLPGAPIVFTLPEGFALLNGPLPLPPALIEQAANDLGDFFYDGHHRFDRRLSQAQAADLWSRALREQLAGRAQWSVLLRDEAAGRVAGLATATRNGPAADLFLLALGEAYRGRGLGRALMGGLLETLAREAPDLQELRSQTAAFNLPALNLYQALGFRPGPPLAALHAWPEP